MLTRIARHGRPDAIVVGVLVSVLTIVIGINLIAIFNLYLPVYFLDEWNHFAAYLNHGFRDYVLTKRIGHSMIAPNLLYRLHAEIFNASGPFLITVGITLCGVSAVLLGRALWQSASPAIPAREKLLAVMVTGAMLFWMVRHQDFLWGLMIHNHITIALVITATLGLVNYLKSPADSATPWKSGGWWWMIITCLVASFSFAAGIAAWAAILLVMLLYRTRLHGLALFAAMAVMTLALLQILPPETHLQRNLRLDASIFTFVPILLGNAWSLALFPDPQGMGTITRTTGLLTGIAGLVILGRASWHCWRSPDPNPILALPLVLGWFAVFASILIFIGRPSANPEFPRFAAWSVSFQVALAWLLLYYRLQQVGPAATITRITAIALCTIFTCIFAFSTWHILPAQAERHDRTLRAGLVLVVAEELQQGASFQLHVLRRELVLSILPELKARQLNLYASPWSRQTGKSFTESYQRAPELQCSGARHLRRWPGRGNVGFYEGWARDQRNRGFSTLVFVHNNMIVGAALPARNAGWPAIFRPRPSTWTGVVNMGLASGGGLPNRAELYGILPDNRACRISPATD